MNMMKRISLYIAAFLLTVCTSAQDAPLASLVPDSVSRDTIVEAATPDLSPTAKADADSAYAHEDFQKAAELYSQLLECYGGSAQLYFNLGNCYYRQDSIARAILCYERARLLSPADDDIRFNLEMARAKTVDRVMPASEMFFVSLFHRLVLSFSLQTWAWLGLLMFIAMLCALAAYFFLPTLTGKKVGFYVAIVTLLICIFANIAAYQQLHKLEYRSNAVIMSSSVVVKSTPSQSGTDLFILHEGTRVEIKDNTMREWVEIQMSDGKEGWMERSDLEVI